MKRFTLFFVCCLVSLIAAVAAFAQQGSQFGYGFTGPQGSSGQYGYGFTGPSQITTVAKAQSFSHGSPVIIKGNIVQAIGGDMYLFRDSSGEIVLRIGPREWQYLGTAISPSDNIEISGEVHRNPRDWQGAPEIHARYIRKL
jgi:uncharacterized protein (TIGR00156 family)